MTKTKADLEELEDEALEFHDKLCQLIAAQVSQLTEDYEKGNKLTKSIDVLSDLDRHLGAVLHAQGKMKIKGWDTDERTEESPAGQPAE